jgi:hypothetical protein
MYRYADAQGNVYVLQSEDAGKLCFEAAQPSGPTANKAALERSLTTCDYMRLMSAFALAIDNRLCQCELRKPSTSMIIALEDGLQRRYILIHESLERRELEGLLAEFLGE